MSAKIIFEVSKEKTIVTAIGLSGMTEQIDITGTDEEKDLIELLKKLRERQLTNTIIKAINIETWQEG